MQGLQRFVKRCYQNHAKGIPGGSPGSWSFSRAPLGPPWTFLASREAPLGSPAFSRAPLRASGWMYIKFNQLSFENQ